jgi:hypothetical protein
MADRSNPDRLAEKTYLVEHYQPRESSTGLARVAGRARAAAQHLTDEGTCVRLVHSLYVPEDESWFLIYESDSPDAVVAAARAVAIPIERVVEALRVSPDASMREPQNESRTDTRTEGGR